MTELVVFRAVQGIGGGAMLALPYTILGVIYPPERRGWAIGLGGSVWGVASVLGPPLGYAIVSTLGDLQRVLFAADAPAGAAAALADGLTAAFVVSTVIALVTLGVVLAIPESSSERGSGPAATATD